MKKVLRLIFLGAALWVAGCATDSGEPSPWETKSVYVNAFSTADLQAKIWALNREGWSVLSTSNLTRSANSIQGILILRRPRQDFGGNARPY